MTLSISSLLLLITNGSLTLLSIYWSATAWRTLRAAQHEPSWQQHTCMVVNSTLEQQDASFCPVVVVTNFSEPPVESTASFGLDGDSQCSTNATQAQLIVDKYEVGENPQCWVSPTKPEIISLVPIRTGVQSEDVNLAAISTVLAIAATLSLAAITFLLCMPHPVYVLPDILTPTAAVAPAITREGLSRNAVDAVLQAAEEADANCSRVATADSVCAICLEDGLGARLSCNHAFHSHCIRAWLQRGGETCPLCCAAVRPPTGFTDSPVVELTPEDSNSASEAETPAEVTVARQSLTVSLPPAAQAGTGNAEIVPVAPVQNEVASGNSRSSRHALPLARRTFVHLPTAFASAIRSTTSPSHPTDLAPPETTRVESSTITPPQVQAPSRPPPLPVTRSSTLPQNADNELRDDPDAFTFAFDLITELEVGQETHGSCPALYEDVHDVDEELISDDGLKEGIFSQTDDDDDDDEDSDNRGPSPVGSAATEESGNTPRKDIEHHEDGPQDEPSN